MSGLVSVDPIILLATTLFGDIPSGETYERHLPTEPKQKAPALLEVTASVPLDALYKCWHMSSRLDPKYYVTDLITEILGGGASSRLFESLVKEQQLFSSIQCSHFGSVDAGLVYIEGKLIKGISMEQAEKAIRIELDKMKNELVNPSELQKVKNKTESLMAFEDISIANRANSLATYELLGDADLMNKELAMYQAVTEEQNKKECQVIFDENNCSTMYYRSKN